MNELPEVGVDGDENPALGFGPLQQRPVTRIRTEFSGLDHVVTSAAQPIGEPAAGTPVHRSTKNFTGLLPIPQPVCLQR